MADNDMKHDEHQEHGEGERRSKHEEHAANEQGHDAHGQEHDDHGGDHEAHADHSGHEQMFRRRFWISLVLSIPVLVFSPTLQDWLGYTIPDFPGSEWITPVFAIIVFLYGGIPFLQMAVPELRNRKPGMMTLISLAIVVAFVYSLASL
ncbi:MAG: heavy metal translocating P-type ATPase, partial [Anaerolineae bacterium]